MGLWGPTGGGAVTSLREGLGSCRVVGIEEQLPQASGAEVDKSQGRAVRTSQSLHPRILPDLSRAEIQGQPEPSPPSPQI